MSQKPEGIFIIYVLKGFGREPQTVQSPLAPDRPDSGRTGAKHDFTGNIMLHPQLPHIFLKYLMVYLVRAVKIHQRRACITIFIFQKKGGCLLDPGPSHMGQADIDIRISAAYLLKISWSGKP